MLDKVIKVLELEEIELNHYLGLSPQDQWQRLYGGQVVGQALVAATKTVAEERHAHSLHGYFLRPGNSNLPILYQVDRVRDGKSFATRRVVATQNGQAIFTLAASFQAQEDGLEHQFDMPDVAQPSQLMDENELIKAKLEEGTDHLSDYFTSSMVEVRQVEEWDPLNPQKTAPKQLSWIKTREKLPESQAIHQCALAYLSDFTILDTASKHHGVSYFQDDIQIVSLDHAMWFHQPFAADEWLLYVQDSPSASGSRAFTRGLIYNQSGQLVASSTQEGLLRQLNKEQE